MLILEANHIRKSIQERLIIRADQLKVYTEDKIGLVGVNGAGKTTLIKILAGETNPDEGSVSLYGSYGYIKQLNDPFEQDANRLRVVDQESRAHEPDLSSKWSPNLSGGEKTRLQITQSLRKKTQVLFADEPTSNLDVGGIRWLEKQLAVYSGAILIISHDRMILDQICNQIWEIEDGQIKQYAGNYSDYKQQKEKERERQQFEYDQYTREKKRLQEAMVEKSAKAGRINKTPKRMGNSEARLHKNYAKKKKGKLEKSVKAIESRIEHMEVKEKPKETPSVRIDLPLQRKLHSTWIMTGEGISKRYGKQAIFNHAQFTISNGSHVALIGDNGSGKTTLLNMICSGQQGIEMAQGVKIGYFSQELETLVEEKTILQNVMQESAHPESLVRTILSRLLFKADDVHKYVHVLSGGEKVKTALAKTFLKDVNVLILDEPTNYLDIYSQEALEEVLKQYEGTLLFASHDRRLINEVASHLLVVENQQITMFTGNYEQYTRHQREQKEMREKGITQDRQAKMLQLENKISEVLGKLSAPGKNDDLQALDREYQQLIQEKKEMKKEK